MRINFNTNQLQQNHTNFKSKLPSVNATYNIDKVYAKFIPDYCKNLQEIVFLLPIIAEIKL